MYISARNSSLPHQLLTVVDASKIEQIPAGQLKDTNVVATASSNSDDYKYVIIQ